jgi:hypothetical protein
MHTSDDPNASRLAPGCSGMISLLPRLSLTFKNHMKVHDRLGETVDHQEFLSTRSHNIDQSRAATAASPNL